MSYDLPKSFFDHIRHSSALPFRGKLTQTQVKAFNDIYSAFVEFGDRDTWKLAYIMATALAEVGKTMMPVRETFAKSDAEAIANLERAWKAGKLPNVKTPYWRDGWFGRGYPQLTHEENYKKISKLINIDVHKNRDAMLRSDVAAAAMVAGMMNGTFTGKKLSDYINDKTVDYIDARKVVNGLDRAEEIAGYAYAFTTGLMGHIIPSNKEIPAMEQEYIVKEKSGMDYTKLVGWAVRMLLVAGGTGGAVVSDGDIQTIASAIVAVIGLIWSGLQTVKSK